MDKFTATERTKLHRMPGRGSYDKETIYGILDDNFICNIAVNINGSANIIPTAFGRKDDKIFVHGSNKNRIFETLKNGEEACVAVSNVNALVLARSAFHHSVNYRSVIIYGKASEIILNDDKLGALKTIMDQMMRGRWEDVRTPTEKELNATTVLEFNLNEVSAKVRSGAPVDDKEDIGLPVWAGILPVEMKYGSPVPDEFVKQETAVPMYIQILARRS